MRNSYSSRLLFVLAFTFSFDLFSQVEQTWVQRYTTFANDAPVAVKTNGSSVYVLGVLNQFQTTANVILIKYNSAGTFQWAAVYNGPSNNQDTPTAMTLDAAGNIYVVGKSTVAINNGTSSETFTLKYNSSGALLWASRYFRTDTYPSELNSVAVDASGNVYSSGSTIAGAPFAYDFMTIKYNSSGVEQWVRTYNGTANSVDMDTRVAVDVSGNIVVTGESQGQLRKGRIITQTFADVYTIKYDPNGNVIWQRRYNNSTYNNAERPKALVLDAAGNVYITGEGSNSSNIDMLTLKYDANGNLLYTARYNGTGNLHDGGKGIVVNGAGEATITGYSDPIGNFAYNFKTIKYNSTGGMVWEQTYNGALNGTDIPNAIAMDGFGNIYVTGESQTSSNYNFVTIRYSSTGLQVWAASYNGPGNASDKAVALSVFTPTGPVFQNATIYVTGASTGSGTGLDIATIRYSQPIVIGNFVTEAQQSLSNYPNPFKESTTIQYNIAYDSKVDIKVIDIMTGTEIETIHLGDVKAGQHEQAFSPKSLKSGSYLYKIVAESPQGQFTQSKMMRIEN